MNGVNLMNGEDAVKLVVREFKQERGKWYNGPNSEEFCVQDILPNQDLATLKNVQVNIYVVIAIIKEALIFYDSLDYINSRIIHFP